MTFDGIGLGLKLARSVAPIALATALAAASSAPAMAQDKPVFRIPIEKSSSGSSGNPAYGWVESTSSCSTTCGTGSRTTTYQCQDVTDFDFDAGNFGAPEPAAQCTAEVGPQPADETASCTVYAGCGYDWVIPSETVTVGPGGREGCGEVTRSFDPYCERSDGTQLADSDHGFCSGDMPDYNDVASGDPDALGYNRTAVETASCDVSDHEWQTGAWGASSSTCSATAFKTRSVQCIRSFDGSSQPDSACAGPKPNTTKVEADYSTCGYSAVNPGAWSAWDSTCSASATRTRSYQCERSDGTIVASSECTSRGINLTESETASNYSSCGYSWDSGAWGAWSSTCSSTATRSRTVTCKRDDGAMMADSACTSPKPATSETQGVYSSCGYSWNTGAWGAWSSTCSSSAVRTRSVTCRRSDGTTVADSSCSGAKPASSDAQAVYSGCGYTGTYGSWSACSSGTQTRSLTSCTRSDGTSVPISNCTSNGVPGTESQSCGGACGSWVISSAPMTATQAAMEQPTKDKFAAHPSRSSYTWAGTQIRGGVYDMDYDYDWNDTAAVNEAQKPDAGLCVTDGQEFYTYYGAISNTGNSRGGYAGGAWGKCVCD